ncbi:MAG: hypothetical protein PF904_17025 [Kiritimatiellae bacterium]|nr:hypothetical protein [Kiritimatiellia bacterium]
MILLTDANILITLHDVGGIPILSQLAPTEILDVVFEECLNDSQPDLKETAMAAGIVVIESELGWLEEAQDIAEGALSEQDAYCFIYARDAGRVLVSGDKPLRKKCKAGGVEYRGLIWVLEEAYNEGLMETGVLCEWLVLLNSHDRRLPKTEIERLKVLFECPDTNHH